MEVEEKEMKTSREENLRHVFRYFMIIENGVVSRPFIGWFFSSHLSSTSTSTSPPPERIISHGSSAGAPLTESPAAPQGEAGGCLLAYLGQMEAF